jgi:hypothetical protein
MSESASTSASESASAAASTANQNSNNGNGSGSGSGSNSSASDTANVASITSYAQFNEIEKPVEKVVKKTVKFNEVDVALENQEVSLNVVLDDEAAKIDDVVVIEDEDTPLAMAKSGVSGRVWWYWILILISAISGKIAKDKRKHTVRNMSED